MIPIQETLQRLAQSIKKLQEFDAINQKNHSDGKLSVEQIHILTEATFYRAYREYENFLHDIFMQYCMEHETLDKKKVKSFLKPNDLAHAEKLVKSSTRFLDWTSPSEVIDRANTYLSRGFPVKDVYQSKLELLGQYKKIRNHIAHNSSESKEAYITVVKSYNGTIPLRIPAPGEYLLYSDKKHKGKYLLLTCFDNLTMISEKIARG
jgi:hypothetical protein